MKLKEQDTDGKTGDNYKEHMTISSYYGWENWVSEIKTDHNTANSGIQNAGFSNFKLVTLFTIPSTSLILLPPQNFLHLPILVFKMTLLKKYSCKVILTCKNSIATCHNSIPVSLRTYKQLLIQQSPRRKKRNMVPDCGSDEGQRMEKERYRSWNEGLNV